MSDADLVNAVRYKLGARGARKVQASEVDRIVLREYGLAPLADRLWMESLHVSDTARRSVGELLKQRFGVRNPRGGFLTLTVFLLTLSMTAPIASLIGSIRRGFVDGVQVAAISSSVSAALLLVAILSTRMRPVARPTLLQSQFITAVLTVSGVVGFLMSSGFTRVAFVAGAGLAIVALTLVVFGRRRDRDATERIDNALEVAHLDVAPRVAAERDRILNSLAIELTNSHADLDAMRAMRSAAITAFHHEGNPATDADPDALPGAYIVLGQTNTWLPLAWPPEKRH